MFNIKWGLFAGASAFFLALIVSLLFGQVGFLTAFLRSLGFFALFSALGLGAWMLINNFIPELLHPETAEDPAHIFLRENPGTKVNITVGDTPEAALPGSDGGVNEVGDISELLSGKYKSPAKDMDQIPSDGYTDTGASSGLAAADNTPGDSFVDFSGFAPEKGSAESGSASDAALSFSGLGSFESGASFGAIDVGGFVGLGDDAFGDLGSFGSDSSEDADGGRAFASRRKSSGSKTHQFEGDFNPQEIAAGIRTVLEKDRKG